MSKYISTIAIDLAKTAFHLVLFDSTNKKMGRKQFNRDRLLSFLYNTPRCVVAMEACGGAFYWAKQAQKAGHVVKLVPPQHSRLYAGKQKNDYNDAEAIGIALSVEKTTYVSIKSTEQRCIQIILGDREAYVREQTATVNRIHGRLLEWGYPIRTGHASIMRLKDELDDYSDLPAVVTASVREWLDHYVTLRAKVARQDRRLEKMSKGLAQVNALQQLPGIGRVNGCSLYSYIGDGSDYQNGRNVSASLGMIPRQHSTGGKQKLGVITKSGDSYTRKQLIHGARSVVSAAKRRDPNQLRPRDVWVLNKLERMHTNKVSVALANKLARAAWRLLATGEVYCEEALFGGRAEAA